jgi:hypothetical protein
MAVMSLELLQGKQAAAVAWHFGNHNSTVTSFTNNALNRSYYKLHAQELTKRVSIMCTFKFATNGTVTVTVSSFVESPARGSPQGSL